MAGPEVFLKKRNCRKAELLFVLNPSEEGSHTQDPPPRPLGGVHPKI